MNISSIAKLAGVSVATVSRVINNSDSVKTATREKILKIIGESNYIPNAMARSLSTSSSFNIGVAFPDIQNRFFSSMLGRIAQKSVISGYNVYFYDTDENIDRERQFLITVQEQRFKGIIMVPVTEKNPLTAAMIYHLEKSGIPVVIVDRDIRDVEIDGIFFDDISGSYKAVKCLLDEGHKKVAMIAGPQNMKPGRDRLSGYVKAHELAGIAVRDEYIVNGFFHSEGGYQAAKQLLELDDPPSAIFSANNLMTLGCLNYFHQVGLEIGRDIAFVANDKIEELVFAGYNITMIERPAGDMGEEALNLLLRRFSEPESIGKVHNRMTIGTNLVLRGSEKIGNKNAIIRSETTKAPRNSRCAV
jgi:LacI family transcriptional regulator